MTLRARSARLGGLLGRQVLRLTQRALDPP